MTDRVAYRIERLPTERWLKVVLGTFLMLAASLWLIGRPAAAASSGIDATARNSELHCLALTIYFEARGESKAGKSAVGHVVMNRVLDRRFPSDACRVVRQGGEWPRYRCQFSWWCDGRSDRPRDKRAWLESIQVASDVLAGRSIDPTQGALWYHADYVSPVWRKAYFRGPRIGRHIFYQEQAPSMAFAIDEGTRLARTLIRDGDS